MSVKTIVGFVLLAVGVISFVYGLNASKSLVEQVSNSFIGRFSETTTWYMIGGFALSVFGLIMLVFGFRGSRG